VSTDSAPATKSLLTITEAANAHIRELLARKGTPDAFLRVAVAGGGCSGLSYKLDTCEAAKATDKVLQFDHGLKALVDMKSLLHIAGMELDYSDDLMNAGFKFRNPNAKSTCGCGESFST
jgi:iron-sulfur cluster assembly accessory protein